MQNVLTRNGETREEESGFFAAFRPMLEATGGMTLGQVVAITGLEAGTIQNWIKRGYVARPVEKKYRERQLARILIIASLRDCMQLERIGELMESVNGSTEDESDDIISESTLYDALCRVMRSLEGADLKTDRVRACVRAATADFRPPDQAAKERVEDALTVMALTRCAALFKKDAEILFQTRCQTKPKE